MLCSRGRFGDRDCLVRAEAINDHDLLGPRQRGQRSPDVLALVERENQWSDIDHTARCSNSAVSVTDTSNWYGIGS